MKKGILLSLLAVILLAVVVCAIWYINEEGKMPVVKILLSLTIRLSW